VYTASAVLEFNILQTADGSSGAKSFYFLFFIRVAADNGNILSFLQQFFYQRFADMS
jgi:hypothetical protein